MKLLIVIVNYRSAALTANALLSLRPELESLGSCHVIIVDNASGDDSLAMLSNHIEESASLTRFATLLPADRNGGFSYGNNFGIRHWLASHAPPDYALLLNPDTIVQPGALRELIEFMDAHTKVGIAGSRLEDPDGTPQ